MAEIIRPKILVVDDEIENLHVMQDILSSISVDVVIALSGEQAVKFSLQQEFALVLLDVNMPELDGFETALQVRQNETNRHTPIIFVTAQTQLTFKGYESGAVDYLQKPFNYKILRSKVIVFLDLYHQRQKILQLNQVISDREARIQEFNEKLQEQVELRTKQLQQAKNEAEVANHAKSGFLSHMSHELLTPMNAIMGFSQIMANHALKSADDKQVKYSKHILKASNHLVHLIEEVLNVTEIEGGKLQLNLNNVALTQVLENSLAEIAPLAKEHNIQLISTFSSVNQAYHISVDTERFGQVLHHILANAIKYNKPQGTVTITAKPVNDDRVQIRVTDTGVGISEKQQANLFQAFNRGQAAYHGIDGLGLGLVISQQLTKAMNGMIGIESTEGEGSCVWIEYPCTTNNLKDSDAKAL